MTAAAEALARCIEYAINVGDFTGSERETLGHWTRMVVEGDTIHIDFDSGVCAEVKVRAWR